MSNIVFDSSAILAFINNKMSADIVEKKITRRLLSTINFAEVVTKLFSQVNYETQSDAWVYHLVISPAWLLQNSRDCQC